MTPCAKLAAMSSRRLSLREARRVVVKVGTNVVTSDGVHFALGRVFGLLEDMAALRREGRQVLLVSSGAVGMGMRALSLQERPQSLALTQACAAVGQAHLMALYNQAFSQLGLTTAQVLLTQEDLADRDRALFLRTTLMRLLEMGVIPILNENDSVSVRELIQERERGFGDNDGLSARVAVGIGADLLILLTDVPGVCGSNPKLDPTAERISVMEDLASNVAKVEGKSSGGTGGMGSKIEAARHAIEHGIDVIIGPGFEPRVLSRLVAGEDVGTLILSGVRRKARHRRIASHEEGRGALVINRGAVEAITERKGSLLPIGVVAVEGNFQRGDVVEIRDEAGRVHGRGLVNYSSRECRAVAGRHSDDIDELIGWKGYNALVTRTNLVIANV